MRIAIVEDEAPIREGLAKILNKIKAEYELVGTASNGLEGVELIRQTRPDLIIMDIRMPKLDGLAMLERLRTEKSKVRCLYSQHILSLSMQDRQFGLGLKTICLNQLILWN